MSMARRVELGAGIGAAILAVLGLVVLTFAPIIAHCLSGPVRGCPPQSLRYESLLQVHVDIGIWAFIAGMLLVVLLGAAGAVVEARFGLRGGIIPLWSGALMSVVGCLTLQGIGIFYFPAILALAIAVAASIQRQRAQAHTTPTSTSHHKDTPAHHDSNL